MKMKAYYAFAILIQFVVASVLKDNNRLAFLQHLWRTIIIEPSMG